MKEIIGQIVVVLGIIGGFGVAGFAVYYAIMQDLKIKQALLEARNKERLAIIEKGMDPSALDEKKPENTSDPLVWGLLLSGVGFGALLGYAISEHTGLKESIMVNSMAILLGGIGLLIYCIVKRRKKAGKNF